MSEELISKKDLLVDMNISYGQLYRWKRKKLIPEEWFIKKSVSTGQETFFPKAKIKERISKILELKDDVSLDKLAEQFSYDLSKITTRKEALIEKGVVSADIIEIFEKNIVAKEIYDQRVLFSLFLYEKLLNSGKLNIQEVNEVVKAMFKDYEKLKEENTLIINRKLGVLFYYVLESSKEIIKDEGAIDVFKIQVKTIMQDMIVIKG